jgi:hypothetical protein
MPSNLTPVALVSGRLFFFPAQNAPGTLCCRFAARVSVFIFVKESIMEEIEQMRAQLLAYQTLISVLLARTSPSIAGLERMRRTIRRSDIFNAIEHQTRDTASEYAAAIEDIFLSASLLVQESKDPPAIG